MAALPMLSRRTWLLLGERSFRATPLAPGDADEDDPLPAPLLPPDTCREEADGSTGDATPLDDGETGCGGCGRC